MIKDINTFIFVAGVGLFFFLLTSLAIFDVLSRDFGGIEKKALWGFIAFIPFIGFIIYFLIGAKKGIKKKI